ncbi:MAG: Serine/threonine-protein kinase PknD [Anaerolineales bacterium]|jgi:tRNA A-37 threonylcarbamoyl transferase component Bud32|nr:protein kinase [Anaerolineae bacterium]MBL8104052.1 protein kinase [Anaerolineales bacterium]MBV6401130.1 Serine/threonine-protein kinase PknD [Anaerolineales bacterium]MCC7190817.1 protein kinase [Anaerolineales bacterium]
MSFNVGDNVGPYKIIEQLGQGGMATVYKAYHASLDRYVAVKALHAAFGEDATFSARFQREARVVAKLEHPNIVPVYDYAEHEKRPYLIMKYIEGDTLKARLNKAPLTAQEIEKVVDSIGSALAYAHKQGILHRDIKPSNVLVANDGVIYLADFGLARIAQSGESTLSSDMIMGTPQYISPEQAMGKKELDNGTDIYSFAVMLYEMVVGQVPFSADTPFSIIHDHIYTPLPLPQSINPKVPEPVQRVLLKALAKERADRYETVDGLVAAFKSAWNEAGVPMQGTLITIAKPVEPSPADKTRMKPTAEPTKMAAKAGAAEPVALAEKKRSPFVWVGVIAVVAICLGSLFVARQNRLFTTFLNRRATATPTFTAPATVTKQAAPPVQTPLRSITPNQPLNLPPEALVAQQRVKDNPNDLQARLDLAVALWSAEMPGASYDTLAELIKLAGANNEAFYIQAGDKFVAIEGWLPAAALYFQARKTYGLGGNVPNNILDGFHQSYYRGAERAEAPSVLPFDKVAQVDQPIALVAQARNAFYSGHIDDAATFLNQVKRLSPNMPEAFLLEAEMNSVTGENEKARLIANGLLADLSAPDWVRAFAEEIIKKLP